MLRKELKGRKYPEDFVRQSPVARMNAERRVSEDQVSSSD